MKRVLKLTLLTMAFILALCGSALAAAGDELDAGFYGIGSAEGVSITALDANGSEVSAVAAETGDTTVTYYEGAVKLSVTASVEAEEGDEFLVLLVDGDELPAAGDSTIRYIDQVSGEIDFTVYPTVDGIKSATEMTLFITSNQEGFETISVPVGFAPDGAFVEAAARYIADVELNVTTRNAMVYGATAYLDCTAKAEAGAEGAAAGEPLSGVIKLVVEGDGYSKTYDVEGYHNTLSIPTIGMNAGTYTVTAVLEDETCMYGGASAPCSFTLAPLEVNVVWSGMELTYNGEVQAPSAVVADGEAVEGETVVLAVSGGQKNAGTHTATATIARVDGGNANPANYVLDGDTCDFHIAGLPVELTGMPGNIVLVNEETVKFKAAAGPSAAKAKVSYAIEDESIAKVTVSSGTATVSGIANGVTNLVVTAATTVANYETTVAKIPVVVMAQPVASITVEGQMGESTLEYTEFNEIVVNAVIRPDQEGFVIAKDEDTDEYKIKTAEIEGMTIEAQVREVTDVFGDLGYEIDVNIYEGTVLRGTRTYSVGYGLEHFYVGIGMNNEVNELDGLVDAVYSGLPEGADYAISVAAANRYAEGEIVENAFIEITTVGVELAAYSNRYEITGTYTAWVYDVETGVRGAILVEDVPFTAIEGEVAITAPFALGTDLAVVKHVDGEGDTTYQQAEVNEDGYYTFTTSDFTGTFEAIEPVVEIMLDDVVVTEDEIGQGKNMTYTAAVGPDGVIESGIVWELGTITNPDGTEYTGAAKNIVTLSKGKVTINKKAPAGTLIEVKAVAAVDASIVGTLTVEVAPTAGKLAIFEDGAAITKTTFGAREMGSDTLTLTAGMADLAGAPMEGALDIEWSSAKATVATVDENGVITAVAPGSAKITAAATIDGKAYKASATVTVTQLPETLTIIPGEAEVAEGKNMTLKVEMDPIPTNKNVTWEIVGAWTDDSKTVEVEDTSTIATLSKGKVTGKSAGIVEVKAVSAADPAVEGTCIVTVIPASLYHNSITVFDENDAKVTKLSLGFNSDYTGSAALYPVVYNSSKQPIEGAAFTWTTSDDEVAIVDDGVVTAVGAGSAKITATSSQGKAATVTVSVVQAPDAVIVTDSNGIHMDGATLMLGQGQKATVKAVVLPEGIKNNKVVWETEDKSVVSVSSGKLTVNKKAAAGTEITITAKSQADAGISDSFTVRVTPMPGKAAIFFNGAAATKATFTVNELGETMTLTAGMSDLAGAPMASDLDFTWTSAKPAVATVDEDGMITAVGTGSAKITATAYDANGKKITVSCTVTVALAATEVTTTSPIANGVLPGKSVTLKATAARFEDGGTKNLAGNKKVVWSIEGDEDITVSTSGKVKVAKTAEAGDTAYVTATAADGMGAKLVFTITVI